MSQRFSLISRMKFFLKLNFLYFFSSHDDYTNLFLFRLNQYLVENKLCANVRLALSVSTKIVKIFTTLSDHSDRMASKLFQMIFNTPRFVEGEGQCSADIATRLKNLILSSSSTNGSSTLTRKKTTANANATADANKYNVIINYFLRVCDLNTLTGNGYSSSKANTGSSKVISEKQQAENALSAHINFCKNSNFVLSLLQFLINLFKVNENLLFSKKQIKILLKIKPKLKLCYLFKLSKYYCSPNLTHSKLILNLKIL